MQGLLAIAELKFFARPLHPRETGGPDNERCYELLKLTSRSFASVIEQLHPDMRNAVMIFYIILRGLDTIEDDTGLDNAVKFPLLNNFRDILKRKDWKFDGISPSEKDGVVLRDFDVVLREFHQLLPAYQDVIVDIAERMGKGMAEYTAKESQRNYDGLKTIADYDLYCHHVAGIVGEGLTRMALIAGFADKTLGANPQLYESMGLFLQKTNIIRDYREDIDDGRSFWPQEIWKKYANDLRDFTKADNSEKGLFCVSELVIHSLRHVIDCLEYLSKVHDASLFRFCAIPQVMSIATLELVFNNTEVFQRNVKISRGLAAELILRSTDMRAVYAIFRDFVRKIHSRNNPRDPNFVTIEILCGKIEQYMNANDETSIEHSRYKYAMKSQYEVDVDFEGMMVPYVAFGFLAFVCGLMMFIGWLFGARYPNPMEEFSKLYEFFLS